MIYDFFVENESLIRLPFGWAFEYGDKPIMIGIINLDAGTSITYYQRWWRFYSL